MKNSFLSVICVLLMSAFFGFQTFADTDPNPDSPTPILLSDPTTSRILAVNAKNWDGALPTTGETIFKPTARTAITLFVKNLDLLADEGANAVRVYLIHQNGKVYQFPVEDLSDIGKGIYALRARMTDEYRGQPPATGDAVIYLTWRGLASNTLKIGLGKTGGEVKIPEALKAELPKLREDSSPNFVGYRWSGDRVRFLEQAAFGPTTELDMRIRRIGLRTWLAEQFDAPYPTLPYPNIPLMPTNIPTDCTLMTNQICFRERYTMQPLQQWFFKEAIYGNTQLRHRVSWALGQVWVTSGVQIQQSSHQIAAHQILSKNAFGNYRDLMAEMTLSPTMGDYLDMARSTRANPNENYPREILQLFGIGLVKLNQDGTVQRDNNGNTIPTYTQADVDNFSKVMTGWSYCNAATCPNAVPGIINYKDPMVVNPANHDITAKTLLNYPNAVNPNIAACAGCTTNAEITAYANDSLNKALDNIFYHPNTAPFVGKLMIQHLVTSDPSPAYVSRVAAAFNNNGANVRGDMKAVIRAILLDPEARGNIKTDPRFGKLREPVQLITNLARIFNAKSFNGFDLSDGALTSYTVRMGQNPFNSPTVFNFFPPDYIVPGTTVLAPEFGILNTGTGISRINTLYTLIFEGLTPNATDSLRGTSLDLSEIVPAAQSDASGNALLDLLNNKMMHGALSPAHRALILNAVTAVPASNADLRTKTAIYLIAASSQYQVQR